MLLANVEPEITIRMTSFWPQDLNHCVFLPSESSNVQVRYCCFYLNTTDTYEKDIYISIFDVEN